ncbi:MAG: ABC transporter ATP-binding protein [Clostridia bacterium]|nr:ABC transporter ATP-binding protein [Clostridia bacterium]
MEQELKEITPPPSPEVPEYLLAALDDYGIAKQDVLHLATTDFSVSQVRCETYVVVTEQKIVTISGSLTLTPAKGIPIFKRKKLQECFEILEENEFDRKTFTSFSYEEQISTAFLVGKTEEERSTIVAASTNTMKEELSDLSEFLSGESDDHKPHDRPPHPPHGPHGQHGPHDHKGHKKEKGKFANKGPMYCPKCGKRYSDPHRKICVHCMDKGKIISRVMEFVIKYRFKVIATILILVLTSALGILSPYISSGFYYDQVLTVGGKFYGQLLFVLILIILTKLLSTGVNILNHLVSSRIAASLRFDLKNVIFESIERLSLKYFTNNQTGSLMTQVTRDSNTIFWFFTGGIPYFLVNVVQIISVSVIMIIIKPTLALIYLAMVPFIFIFMKMLFASMGKYHGMRWVGARKLNALVSDTFSGMRVVKAFSREKDGSDRFEIVNKYSANADRTASRYSTTKFPLINVIMTASNLLVLGIGGWMVIKGNLDYGKLMTFTAYTAMIYNPMQQFVHMSYQATDSLNAMNRLIEIMDAEPDVFEAEEPVTRDTLNGDISFSHVDFGYDASRLVLKDINFDIKGGTILGVVGHTGAGKSTLANLLMRMYDVNSGDITIDGLPIKSIASDTLRKNIAIVSQETYLFVGSILDNIRYANPEASTDEIIKAAKISGAHDFIVKLPDGYSTMIGFGQRELSGGERQRLSIARALLRDPSILILDEATAAMDTQTERKIQNALEILIKGKTTIMIAHRLSTLRMADKLVVLKDGEICEMGSHEELIKAKGEYFKLYSLQLAALKNVGVEE